jgi:YidC/Oxa1 family membrane protein insertase
MDNKRLLLWMVVTLASLFILYQIQTWFFPRPPAPTQAEATKPKPPAEVVKPKSLTPEEEAAAQVALLRGLVPDAPALLLELQAEKAIQKLVLREWERERLAQLKAKEPPPPPDTDIILGDATKTKLLVTLSSRHANVRSIVLTKHLQATQDYGRPDPNNRALLLLSDQEAIKGNPEERQSYRLLFGAETLTWQVKVKETDKVVFEADVPGKQLKVLKTFTLRPQTYHIDLEISFEGTEAEVKYELTGPRGLPVEAMKWRQQPFRYLMTCVTKPGEPGKPIRFMEEHAKLGKAELLENKRVLTDPAKPTHLVYAGVMLPFFTAAIVVDREQGQDPPGLIDHVQYEDLGSDKEAQPFQATYQGRVSLRLHSRPFKVEPTKPVKHRYLLYAGPTKPLLLNYEADVEEGLVQKYITVHHLNTLTDYHWFAWTGALGLTTIFVFFTNLMHSLLENLSIVFGYGGAIIVMTIIVRLLLYPISRKQAVHGQEMSAKMAKIKPEMAKLKEKFKNDPQGYQLAQMELWRKHGFNPFSSCTGCLVMLLQMPIFMGLYYALNESVHLRLAPFLWMPNLAAPDMLVNWSDWWVLGWLGRGFQIPLIGTWFHLGDFLHILPIISVLLMYIHQKKVAPPAMDEQQEMQLKMMNYMMFFFAYMFYWIPSGLCLYFIVSSGWGLLERQFFMPKKPDAKTEAVVKEEKPSKDGKASKDGKVEAPTGLMARITAWWEKMLKEAEKKR